MKKPFNKNWLYNLSLILPARLRRPFLIKTLLSYYLGSPQTLHNSVKPSDKELTVIIPVIEKDLAVLPFTLKGIQEHIHHPIHNILIVAPNVEPIKKSCEENKVQFLLESDILGYQWKEEFAKLVGKSRSGWWYQQMLKLYCTNHVSTERFLVVDADTVLLQPYVFEENGKSIFYISDEFYIPYREGYEFLMRHKSFFPFSFVAHMMCFEKTVVKELIKKIQGNTYENLVDALLEMLKQPKPYSFAEYETYGNYYLQQYPNQVILRYWFNLPSARKYMSTAHQQRLASCYKSVSYHSYL